MPLTNGADNLPPNSDIPVALPSTGGDGAMLVVPAAIAVLLGALLLLRMRLGVKASG